ncbi:MAG: adenylate/guanylate cyclase domain-containing protein [Candidatus Marinimicrobia bacterium]|nr:adenylate/guanylate cyclase domain-containing protein [Candidatus Neomarinimicrobiota bacterium]
MRIFSKLTLSSELEQEFRLHYAHNSLRQIRAGAILGLAMIDSFAIYDYFYVPEAYLASWVVRFAYLTPVILLWLWSSYRPRFITHMQPISMVILILVGLGYLWMGLLAPPESMMPKFGGPMLLTLFIYTASKLWLSYASLAGWSVLLAHMTGLGLSGQLDGPTMVEGFIFFSAANLLGMIAAFQLERSFRRDFIQAKEIEIERNRSDALLLNILPAPIADRLKAHEAPIADGFEDVTILFADIVGFTQLSATLSPSKLVEMLDALFTQFDELSEVHELEKIKTIGDAYMAVSGLPEPNENHAENAARAALAMLQVTRDFIGPDGQQIKVRIGLNTGPVVAGVIGSRKFIYDLWGDAVNIASRMETHGLPGAIQVTETTFRILDKNFNLEARGLQEIKGRGRLETYLLLGEKSAGTPSS